MKVSIIVAAYNIENYIKRCMDSIVSQTFKDIEIIVVMMVQQIILQKL